MNIIAYNTGIDTEVDYAPESFLNQGMSRLVSNAHMDQKAMGIRRYQRYTDIVRERIERIDHGITGNSIAAVY